MVFNIPHSITSFVEDLKKTKLINLGDLIRTSAEIRVEFHQYVAKLRGDKGLYPIYVSKLKGIAIDLLHIVDGAHPEKTHFIWIKNLTKMCHYTSKHKWLKHLWHRCLHVFSRADLLEAHQNDCLGIGEKLQRTIRSW